MVSLELLKNVVSAGVVDGRGQACVGVIVAVTVGVTVRVGVEVGLDVIVGVSEAGDVGTEVKVGVEAGGTTSGVRDESPANIQPTGSMDPFVGRACNSKVGADICSRYALTGSKNGSEKFSLICC